MIDARTAATNRAQLDGPEESQRRIDETRRALDVLTRGPLRCWGCPAPVERPGYCTACTKIRHEEEQAERRAQTLRTVPRRYQWATGLDVPALTARVTPASAIATARAATAAQSVVLVGPTGAGKTSLAVALLMGRITQRHGGFFVDSRELVRARTEHRLRDGGEAELVEHARGADLLLLDELGAERGVGLAEDVVGELVHERHAHERPTIFCTPFLSSAIKAKYGDGIARRIYERATVIPLGTAK